MADTHGSLLHPVDPFKAALLNMPQRLAVCFSCAAKRKAVRRWQMTDSFRGECQNCHLRNQSLGWLEY